MMTLKNFEIINAVSAIKELIKITKMTTKIKWNFIKNLNKLQNIINDFSKTEVELIKEYALKDENGDIKVYDADEGIYKKGEPKFAPVNEKLFIKERNELLQCESDVEVHKIKIDDLPEIEDGTLLLLCQFLIDDEE